MSGSLHDSFKYAEPNSSSAYNNPKFITALATNIQVKLRRKLTDSEIRTVATFTRNLDNKIFLNFKPNDVINFMTKKILEKFAHYDCADPYIDTHEILKGEIGISGESDLVRSLTQLRVNTTEEKISDRVRNATTTGTSVDKILGQSSGFHIQKIFNPNALLRTNYVILDSRYRVLDTDGRTFFKWDFVNSTSRNQGSVNAVGTIRDIVALRVYPIRLPYNSTMDNSYKRITMLIKEFQAQSFVGHENKRFHFVFNPLIVGDSVFLQPENNNDGYYRFGQPVTQFDTLTIDFASPLENVEFDIDRLRGQVSIYADGIQTEFQVGAEHNLLTGSRIYIENFSSLNNLATSTITSEINSSTGHSIIVTGPDTFKINVDSSNITTLIEGGAGITLTSATRIISGLTTSPSLITGSRIRVTSDPAVLPLTVDEVFNVHFFDPVGGDIYIDRDPAIGVVNPVWVYIDYRPPPLTSTSSVKEVSPSGGLTVTANTPIAGQSTVTGGVNFINEFIVGQEVTFFSVNPVINDGPHVISSIPSDSSIVVTRASAVDLANVSSTALVTLDENIFTIYFGSKRIFVPIEITFIAPEV